MGTYINTITEIKQPYGKWRRVDFEEEVLAAQNYDVFAFLGDVRNDSKVPSIASHRGFPEDSEHLEAEASDFWGSTTVMMDLADRDNFGFSWVTLDELFAYDYTQTVIDARDYGTQKTLKDFLGEGFFDQLDRLARLGGNPEHIRLVFWFD